MSDRDQFGESWLFYGCRHKEQDYLYRLVVDLAKINRKLILKTLSGPSADQVNHTAVSVCMLYASPASVHIVLSVWLAYLLFPFLTTFEVLL